MYFDVLPMLLTSSLGLSSFIFFLVMWPRKPAWILAAALFAAGSSRGMSMMSSSCGWVHPSCSSDKTQSAILAMTTWQKNSYRSLSRSTLKRQRTFTLCNATWDQSVSRTPSVKWLQQLQILSPVPLLHYHNGNALRKVFKLYIDLKYTIGYLRSHLQCDLYRKIIFRKKKQISYELATTLPKCKIVMNCHYSMLVLLKTVVEIVESFHFYSVVCWGG